MPKSKRKEETSDSDSGPEDKGPEKKKPAPSKKSSKDDNEHSWPIDKMKFVTVREFKNKTFVDVREFYEKDGDLLPGRKGISLNVTQWGKLKDLIPEIDKAISEM